MFSFFVLMGKSWVHDRQDPGERRHCGKLRVVRRAFAASLFFAFVGCGPRVNDIKLSELRQVVEALSNDTMNWVYCGTADGMHYLSRSPMRKSPFGSSKRRYRVPSGKLLIRDTFPFDDWNGGRMIFTMWNPNPPPNQVFSVDFLEELPLRPGLPMADE